MNVTTAIREQVRTGMPLEDLLPDTQPAFVRSPAYFFDVVALSALALLIVTGIVLAAFGPQWYHGDAVCRFTNSLHSWGVQVLFFALTLHLWSEFFNGAWRHGHWLTWVLGVITSVAGIGTAFTRGCTADQGASVESARPAVGHDERDGQLPRSSLALALHLLVPDPADKHLSLRLRLRLADHGRADSTSVMVSQAAGSRWGSRAGFLGW